MPAPPPPLVPPLVPPPLVPAPVIAVSALFASFFTRSLASFCAAVLRFATARFLNAERVDGLTRLPRPIAHAERTFLSLSFTMHFASGKIAFSSPSFASDTAAASRTRSLSSFAS